MESMNVDDVSTSLSNLDIATTNENSPIADAHPPNSPKQRRHAPTTTFLSLPWSVKWHVYTHLPSRDCIALSRTCRQMYSFNTFAYTHLQFLPPNSLFSLARSIYRLSEVLACSRHYADAVRTVRIIGWNTVDIPEGCTHEAVYRALDDGIAALLEKSPHVYSFILDLNQSKAINYFPKTFTALTLVRTIRNLRLATFLVPSYTAENNPLLAPVPNETPPAYQRVCLSVCSGEWLPILMHDPRNLRWFAFNVLDTDKAPQPGDTNWAMTLRRVAEAATELETLALSGGRHFDAEALGQMLQFGFDREIIRKLRSFSVNATTLSLSSLTQIFCGFARASVTHLKIVVNHYGTWLPDFGPHYLFELAKLLPNLEEITLDQLAMPDVAPLPGQMDIWGEAFRMFKKLRRIAFSSMFVLDLCRPRPVEEDEEDYEEDEGETGGDEDAGMDMDMYDSDDEGDEGYETDDGKNDGTPHDALAPNLVHLAAWADRFLDDHLRMREPFTEIWFLDPRFPGQTAAGFNQRVMEGDGEGAKAEHMIYYPILERHGWWWDEYEPIPLD